MADRVGVIDRGRLILVEETAALMRKLGKRRLTITMQRRIATIPPSLTGWALRLEAEGERLVYDFDAKAPGTVIPHLLRDLDAAGIDYRMTSETSRSSLEGHLRGARGGPGVRGINLPGIWAIYRARDGAHASHDMAERGDSRDNHGALLHRDRRRDPFAYAASVRRRLRRVHRAGPHHADAVDARHFQCIDRDLLP